MTNSDMHPKPYVDPLDLPSDARMIDWVEAKNALVSVHHGRGEWKWRLWIMFEEGGYGRVTSIEESGPTWRAVVEAAMRRLP